jgi:hypothetical protein
MVAKIAGIYDSLVLTTSRNQGCSHNAKPLIISD